VTFHSPTSIPQRPSHQCSLASVVLVSAIGPWKLERLNQCVTMRLSAVSALPITAPFDHPSCLLRHTPVTGASPSGRRSTNVTGSPATPPTDWSSILHTTEGVGTHDSSTTPGASCGASPPTGPSCSTIGCPGSLKAYTGESGETASLAEGCVLMAPS
jgi:hypothetical protein